ncbi:MAG: ATP-binding protein, partial [Planctomycetota bacterium]|nr:ATP-binding protein [Planctomycetota bacterium]
MIQRTIPLAAIESRFRSNPVVMLLGPRQCGKTTLARAYARGRNATYFDLESPPDAQRLEQALITLEPLRGTVIIDEAQLRPELFPVLRVLADRKPVRARFLLLGSAAPELVQGGSESLAGRIALLSIGGFHLPEVGGAKLRSLWTRGGFPRSFLARSDAESELWRLDFIQTFLERDLRKFGVLVAPITLRRFWNMLAHYHGQICNTSEIGRSLGESHTTIRRHLDILCGAYVLRQLPPWFENLGKRQVKSPKVYLRDSGILHALLGIGSFRQLESHPKLGASWEGFAMEEVLNVTGDR